MNAIKVTRTIHSQNLRIKELEGFQGKTVEIIILVTDEMPPSEASLPPRPAERSAAGMLSKYRNPDLIEQEQFLKTNERKGT